MEIIGLACAMSLQGALLSIYYAAGKVPGRVQ
jgi:hypothetical protein